MLAIYATNFVFCSFLPKIIVLKLNCALWRATVKFSNVTHCSANVVISPLRTVYVHCTRLTFLIIYTRRRVSFLMIGNITLKNKLQPQMLSESCSVTAPSPIIFPAHSLFYDLTKAGISSEPVLLQPTLTTFFTHMHAQLQRQALTICIPDQLFSFI